MDRRTVPALVDNSGAQNSELLEIKYEDKKEFLTSEEMFN